MKKVSKYTLTIEEDFDYDLIGLCCHQSDYRLCWALNEQLGLKLAKSEEPFMVSSKKGDVLSKHSFYEWVDEENYLAYFLIKNKDGIQYLIPEKSQIDYFLIIKESGQLEIDNLLTQIKGISAILTAFKYDPAALKSSKNLIL